MSTSNRKRRSGNPAKAAEQERQARERAAADRAQGRRRPSFRQRLVPSREDLKLAFAESPAWTRWVAVLGLVLAVVTVTYSWVAVSQATAVGVMAWVLLVVATALTVSAMVGMVTGRDTWTMAGVIMAAAAPTGNLYLVNALTLTCGIALAWGLSRANRS